MDKKIGTTCLLFLNIVAPIIDLLSKNYWSVQCQYWCDTKTKTSCTKKVKRQSCSIYWINCRRNKCVLKFPPPFHLQLCHSFLCLFSRVTADWIPETHGNEQRKLWSCGKIIGGGIFRRVLYFHYFAHIDKCTLYGFPRQCNYGVRSCKIVHCIHGAFFYS